MTSITYSSSNENVVKVNPNTGVLTVVGAGTATIHVVGAPTDEPRQDATFDLSGRPVNPQTAQRGLYILRGKKVVKAKE